MMNLNLKFCVKAQKFCDICCRPRITKHNMRNTICTYVCKLIWSFDVLKMWTDWVTPSNGKQHLVFEIILIDSTFVCCMINLMFRILDIAQGTKCDIWHSCGFPFTSIRTHQLFMVRKSCCESESIFQIRQINKYFRTNVSVRFEVKVEGCLLQEQLS